jgi:hypothetical protein
MRSKTISKALAVLLALVMVFGISVTVFAEEAEGDKEAEAVAEEMAIPTTEESIFIAPLRPENAQELMDLFALISGEEGEESFDLAMLLAGEENELTDEEIEALQEALEGFDEALSYGYLTSEGTAIIDAAALELEDGEIIKAIVLNEGKPAIIETEVADGVASFEVTEPSVCFAFALAEEDAAEEEGEAIPTAEGSIFIAPLRPENAQPLMDLFAEITGEEGKTSFDLAMLLAGEDNELTDEELGALEEALEGFDVALSNGYLTSEGTAIIDAAALELEDGDIIKGIVLNEGKPAVVEIEVEEEVAPFEVIEPSVCFIFALSE